MITNQKMDQKMDQQIKNYIDIALVSNIIVFDADAPLDTLTIELFYLMDCNCAHLDIGNLESIFVPPHYISPKSRYQIDILDGLEKNGIYNNYYKIEQGCSFAPNDNYLVIGITDRNNVILGSY